MTPAKISKSQRSDPQRVCFCWAHCFTGQFYAEVLRHLKDRVRARPPGDQRWLFLHHDNAPSHTSLASRELLSKFKVEWLPQPPYGPDYLAPSDFCWFPQIKRPEREAIRYDSSGPRSYDEVPWQLSARRVLKSLRTTEKRWQRCVNAYGLRVIFRRLLVCRTKIFNRFIVLRLVLKICGRTLYA